LFRAFILKFYGAVSLRLVIRISQKCAGAGSRATDDAFASVWDQLCEGAGRGRDHGHYNAREQRRLEEQRFDFATKEAAFEAAVMAAPRAIRESLPLPIFVDFGPRRRNAFGGAPIGSALY
jgi:hypothetical protein